MADTPPEFVAVPDHPAPDSAALLDQFSSLYPKKIDLSLGRITALLAALDNPHHSLPPVVHIAGTNGKGSVQAMIVAILTAAGYGVHAYTSPHLVRFHERIALSAGPGQAPVSISEEHLVRVLSVCAKANDGREITFFEITTAAAFLAFHETPADFIVLETGLGGRFDATNVVARPVVSVITRIDLDHAEFLGTDVRAIAREKAGIFKAGCEAVASPQHGDIAGVLRDEAARVRAPLALGGVDFVYHATDAGLMFKEERPDGPYQAVYARPSLPGPHQLENAATAIAAVRRLCETLPDMRVGDDAISAGLGAARWPARLQRLPAGRMGAAFGVDLSAVSEVWLDGGHNPSAGRALAAALAEMPPARLSVIFGMLAHKDVEGFLKPLAAHVSHLYAVPVGRSESGLLPEMACQQAAACGIGCSAFPSVGAALAAAAADAQPNERLLFCGSLYLAGEILGRIEAVPEPR